MPSNSEDVWSPSVLIGARDEEAENNREAARLLTRAGAPVLLEIDEGLGHAFPKERDRELRRALDFVLRKVVPGSPP